MAQPASAGATRNKLALIATITNICYGKSVSTKTTSIALGKPFTDFALRKVESGEFGSTSEVVREAMRRFISQDAKREALDRALEEGLASPIDETFDIDEWFDEEFGR